MSLKDIIIVKYKLIITERLYIGKDAHDYVVIDAYKLFSKDGDNYTLTLIQDALNKGDISYDAQRIFSFVDRLNRSHGTDELFARYNRDNSWFDIAIDDRKQKESSQKIHRNSQETIAGERISLRDKPSIQKADELLKNSNIENNLSDLLNKLLS